MIKNIDSEVNSMNEKRARKAKYLTDTFGF